MFKQYLRIKAFCYLLTKFGQLRELFKGENNNTKKIP